MEGHAFEGAPPSKLSYSMLQIAGAGAAKHPTLPERRGLRSAFIARGPLPVNWPVSYAAVQWDGVDGPRGGLPVFRCCDPAGPCGSLCYRYRKVSGLINRWEECEDVYYTQVLRRHPVHGGSAPAAVRCPCSSPGCTSAIPV